MIKGFYMPFGYMGLVEGHYILFATEDEYYEYLEERERNGDVRCRLLAL